MIELRDPNGARHIVSAAAIARIVEAGPSSQWHGIRSVVHLFDGKVIEVQEECALIRRLIEEQRGE